MKTFSLALALRDVTIDFNPINPFPGTAQSGDPPWITLMCCTCTVYIPVSIALQKMTPTRDLFTMVNGNGTYFSYFVNQNI